jgi:hypothetical protein
MSTQDPQLRSAHDARHALMCLGYSQANIDKFVPDPDVPKDNPIVGQPNPRQRRVLLAALRKLKVSLEDTLTHQVAGMERSNLRADLDTVQELIATLQH